MSNIVAVLIVRCTHTGVYADGRPNPASVTLYDLDEITIQKNRTRAVPIPFGSGTIRPPVDIPMSTRTFVSWHSGDICKFTMQGLITSEIVLQLRDKGNCGGPAGTGQTLQPAVLNAERVGNVLRLVIPDNVIPTLLDSIGFLEGEPVAITGLSGAFRKLNGTFEITSVAPGVGLAGAAVGSYLLEVPSVGPDIAADTLVGVNLCLAEGRVVAQFGSLGNVGGLGTNVFGYIGGQLFPNAGGGGGGSLAIFDEGILIDAAATSIDFIGAGVTASSAGAGAVDVTIPGGGGGGAPADAQYLVLATNATLTDERVFTAGTGVAVVDGGAGSTFTVSVDATFAEILANDNSTGGSNIVVSTGDTVVGVTDLVLDPGAGGGDNVIIDGLTWPSVDGTAGQAIITNSFGVLSFGNPIPAAHAPTHAHNGTDEIDGDVLDITYVPTNYVRDTTPPEVTSVEELTAHLAGIDTALGSLSEVFTSGEALTTGDVLTLNAVGEVIRANSSIAGAIYEVIGVSAQTVGASVSVQVVTKSGSRPNVRFGGAPAAGLNGTLVFLDSTSGQATTTPPTSNGNTLFTIGTLQGADGATTTPVVVFRPQFIAFRV